MTPGSTTELPVPKLRSSFSTSGTLQDSICFVFSLSPGARPCHLVLAGLSRVPPLSSASHHVATQEKVQSIRGAAGIAGTAPPVRAAPHPPPLPPPPPLGPAGSLGSRTCQGPFRYLPV